MAKKKAKKKATKSSAKKSLKLRKKPLRDLPARRDEGQGRADASLSPSQQAALKSTDDNSRCSRPRMSPWGRPCRLLARAKPPRSGRRMSRVLLISMPWDQLEHPPIQLASCTRCSSATASAPRCAVSGWTSSITAWPPPPTGRRASGSAWPTTISSWSCRATSGSATGSSPSPRRTATPGTSDGCASIRSPERDIDVARRFRALVPSFLDRCAETLAAAAPAVVGFTTGAQQTARLAGAGPAPQGSPARPPHRLRRRQLPGPDGRGAAPRVSLGGRRRPRRGRARAARAREGPPGRRPVPPAARAVLPRRRALGGRPRRRDPVALDDVPTPRYDDYFDAARARRPRPPRCRPGVTLLYESARGCWWGATSHCTFCGISDQALAFRSKRPERVVQELLELTAALRHDAVPGGRLHPRPALLPRGAAPPARRGRRPPDVLRDQGQPHQGRRAAAARGGLRRRSRPGSRASATRS